MSRLPLRSMVTRARIAGCLLAILAFAGAAASAAPDEERSKAYYADARSLIGAGRIDGAVDRLESAIEADPDNLAARDLLGGLYVQLGDGRAAERELREARARGLDEVRVLVPLGRAYLLQGKYEQVLDEVRSGGRGGGIEAEVLLLRGQAYIGLDRLEEAAEALQGAARMRLDDPRPKLALARMSIDRGDLAAAEEQADAALARAPGVTDTWLLKGELRRLDRDLEAAVRHFTRALEIDPQSFAGRLQRAASLIDLDRDDEARTDIDAVREVAPSHPLALYLSALIAAKRRDYAAAEGALREALRTLDGHLPSMFLLGVVNYAQGELDAAEANLRRYLEADPNHAAARKMLGAALIRKSDPAGAVEVLLPALKLAPNDRQTLALLGSAYMQNRQYSESTVYFEKAADAAPGAASSSAQLALSRSAIGESEAAATDLGSGVELDPLAVQSGILLALGQMRERDYEAALEAATALVERLPGNPLAYNLRGTAALGTGNAAAARSDYQQALELRPDYVPAQMNLARLDLAEGDARGAKARLGSIVADHRGHAGALIALAELAQREGRDDEAASWLERARETNPSAVAPRLRLVNLYLRVREGAKALAVARELDRIAGRSPHALDALAQAQVAVGDAHSAVATYRRLVELAPNSAESHHRLAAAQAAAQDQAGARESLRTATSVEPDYLPAWVALVEIEMRANRTDEALALAAALREARPDAAIGDMLAGDILMRMGEFSDAAGAYRAAMKKEKSGALAARLYSARIRAGDTDAALAPLEEWVAANPGDRATRRVLASAYLKARRYRPAIEHHERLLESEPNDAMVLRNLAWASHEAGDARALGYAQKAFAIAPQSVPVLDTLGWILVRRGHAGRGLELLGKASARAPREAGIGYHLAVALAASGRRDEARRTLEKILESGHAFDAADKARNLLQRLSGG